MSILIEPTTWNSKLINLSKLEKLNEYSEKISVAEFFVALESTWKKQKIMVDNNPRVRVKALPSAEAYSEMAYAPATVLSKQIPIWRLHFKRLFDIFISVFLLIFCIPIFLIIAIGVRFSSKGTIFFKQERIGKNGKPFIMYKFRSMFVDAEKNGPALSSKNDKRITPFGFFIRRTHLDEIPQFFNVLIGNMSFVGHRPERQFYIDQVVQRAPQYLLLQRLKPGITSWGQVKFGYAENVDEMLERLKYDALYFEDMSFFTDLKILVYTVFISLKRNGK